MWGDLMLIMTGLVLVVAAIASISANDIESPFDDDTFFF